MGDPKRLRKRFDTPAHPWRRARIESEKEITYTYGLKNKQEIWKMQTILKTFAASAKRLIAASGKQADLEKKQLFARLERLGLLTKGAKLEDILEIRLEDVLNRRLQTVVQKRKLAHSAKQARQFITHQHIQVGEKCITSPSYLVKAEEEQKIGFVVKSPMFSESHPERVLPQEPKGKKGGAV